jgi:CRP-like cAMP-binding protein
MQKMSLLTLFQTGRKLTYTKDEVIIRAEDIPSGVYYITSGWVKAYIFSKGKDPTIIMTLFPGDIFPEAWAVTGNEDNVNFAAIDETEVLRVPTKHFNDAIAKNSYLAQEMLKNFAYKFFAFADELSNIPYHTAREKVIYRLLFLAKNFGQQEDNKIIIRKHVPNEYIARSTNMTRETTSREMSRLTRKRLIRHTEDQIIISDIDGLINEVEDLSKSLVTLGRKTKLSNLPAR